MRRVAGRAHRGDGQADPQPGDFKGIVFGGRMPGLHRRIKSLGTAEAYIEALREFDADILGMSALLTTTMPYMKVVIDTLKEKGIREDLIVLVGGAPLNEEFGKAIGADAYCRDAATAVETAKRLVGGARLSPAGACFEQVDAGAGLRRRRAGTGPYP